MGGAKFDVCKPGAPTPGFEPSRPIRSGVATGSSRAAGGNRGHGGRRCPVPSALQKREGDHSSRVRAHAHGGASGKKSLVFLMGSTGTKSCMQSYAAPNITELYIRTSCIAHVRNSCDIGVHTHIRVRSCARPLCHVSSAEYL